MQRSSTNVTSQRLEQKVDKRHKALIRNSFKGEQQYKLNYIQKWLISENFTLENVGNF